MSLQNSDLFEVSYANRDDTSVGEDIDNFLSAPPPLSVQSSIKDWFRQQLPQLYINVGSMGFFKTQNLLMPGQQVIDIDEGASVKMPLPWVMVGNIIQKS